MLQKKAPNNISSSVLIHQTVVDNFSGDAFGYSWSYSSRSDGILHAVPTCLYLTSFAAYCKKYLRRIEDSVFQGKPELVILIVFEGDSP